MSSWIILQGPLSHHREMIESYRHFSNLVWTTWVDEDAQKVQEVLDSGIQVLQIEKPLQPGSQNVNLQCASATAGIVYAADRGAKFALKVRHDLAFSDPVRVLELIERPKLSFLSYHNWRGGYLVDYFNGGPIEEMLSFWDMQSARTDMNAEVIILENWLNRKGLENRRDYEYIKDRVHFLMGDILEQNIKVHWHKIQRDLSSYAEDKLFCWR